MQVMTGDMKILYKSGRCNVCGYYDSHLRKIEPDKLWLCGTCYLSLAWAKHCKKENEKNNEEACDI